ncbi:MAG: hypothetical protein KGI71_05420 [Patescibacteria group bacterium]|nr:hypothetical protein [Patescibacteria group bacterium]
MSTALLPMTDAKYLESGNIPPSPSGQSTLSSGRDSGVAVRSGGGAMQSPAQTFTYSLPGNTTATLRIDGPPLDAVGAKLLGKFLDLVKDALQVAPADAKTE